MKKLVSWYKSLSKRKRDGAIASATIVGAILSILSAIDVSLADISCLNVWCRLLVLLGIYVIFYLLVYSIIGILYKDSIRLRINQIDINVHCGDIFDSPEYRLIPCDTHFDIRVDDVVISKKSIHGQFILNHANVQELSNVISNEAKRLQLDKDSNDLYDFPIGTIIRYDSSVDGHTYLLLAMSKLDKEYKARTDMPRFEHMLMKMWSEIDRVHASNDIAIPLLGSGTLRFDDGLKTKETLFRCMLCTLKNSGVSLNSKLNIVIFGDNKDIPLYEFKELFS